MEYFKEYKSVEFKFEDTDAYIVFPNGERNGRWSLKTEYPEAFPDTERELLTRGYCVAFLETENRWGRDMDLARKSRFVKFLSKEYGLESKCVPIGMSCGGLIAIKFAAKYPDCVACIYIDAPVVNYMSCPCGFGVGEALDGGKGIAEILSALNLDSLSELFCYTDMPKDNLPLLIKNRIPAVMVAGDSDRIVPYCENGLAVQRAYEKTDIPFEVYIKPGCDHHPHGLDDVTPIADFIDRNYK